MKSATLEGEVVDLKVLAGDMWGRMVLQDKPATDDLFRDRETSGHVVTGNLLGVFVGDRVRVEGHWTEHPRFGRQFKSRSIAVLTPKNRDGVITWMKARLPHIGYSRGHEMIDTFGVDGIWEALSDTESLMKLRGVTLDRAKEIVEAYSKHSAEREVIVELCSWGLSNTQASRAVSRWTAKLVVDTLREDPYKLTDLFGIGFKKADAIARNMGLPTDHVSRMRAGVLYTLDLALMDGHVFLTESEVVERARSEKVLGVAPSDVRRGIESLLSIEGERARPKLIKEGNNLYAYKAYMAERAVANFVTSRTEESS